MLSSYLNRLYDTVVSRGYIEVEELIVDDRSNRRGTVRGRLRFHDGSLLEFAEVLITRNGQVMKLRYTYHYQDELGEMIFRYDNAPHYPDIATHLHHKHVGTAVEPSQPPDLSDVLSEIDTFIFAPE